MSRLIAWIALIAVVVWLWRRVQRRSAQPSRDVPPEQPQMMVRCARCPLHVPRAQAFGEPPRWYCSREHQQQDAQ